MGKVYEQILNFNKKFPSGISWREKQHAKVVEDYIDPDEEILYAFLGQKNDRSVDIFNTYAVVLTNKRIMVATKRVVFGYFLKSITPDMYNDLTIGKGIIWGRVVIDTIKEVITITNIDARALDEVETSITEIMIKAKKEYEEKKD